METEEEASSFETSEMLATFLTSTPLLSESWKLCRVAKEATPQSFVANSVGEVTYIAFSVVQPLAGLGTACGNLVPIDGVANIGFFPWLNSHAEGDSNEEPVMVHGGLLHLFLSIYNNPIFQNQIMEIIKKSKFIVFTGHSIGSAIASLSAIWLLSHIQSIPSPPSVLSITFGSTMLGNESLSKAILKQRWAGNFCHLIGKHDIVPRLLLAPVAPLTPHLDLLIQYWHLAMTSSQYRQFPAVQLPDETTKSQLFVFVLAHMEALTKRGENTPTSSFWPFGSYLFCTNKGAVCIDNATAVVKLLYLMFATASPCSCIEDHLNYGDYVDNLSVQCLKRNELIQTELPESSYEAGIALALHYSEMDSHVSVSGPTKDCLKMVKRMGRAPSLNSAQLAIGLAKITPLRAQIEWYKASCDESDYQMGYYDSFKLRGASRRDFKVNMNRIRLAQFWNDLLQMLETNQLPYNFHKRAKWVNASQSYKLLVEPLDIAEYYRTGMHQRKGHYIPNGRKKRYKIFDKWWKERKVGAEENNERTKFASLTQDSCFWARVEEAREWLDNVRTERDKKKITLLCENMDNFHRYASTLVERKEVSIDVLVKNSSYSLWAAGWGKLKSQFQQITPQFPSFVDGEIVP